MSNFEDISCTSSVFNTTLFPSVTTSKNFSILKYNEELSKLEKVTKNPFVAYRATEPDTAIARGYEREIFNNVGDLRFNGVSAYNFIKTRYKTVGTPDINIDKNIPVIGCDENGSFFTYTIPNTAIILDQQKQDILVPIFDKYGQNIVFPITNLNGDILKTEQLTAIDSAGQTIYFPLKDIKFNRVYYPFFDLNGNQIYTPPVRNSETVSAAQDAYDNLNIAYDNAKDSHAYKFARYIRDLESVGVKLSFFSTDLSSSSTSFNLTPSPFFGVAVYKDNCPSIDLTSITNSCLQCFIRYYPDRADFVYKIYKELCGEAPYTKLNYSSQEQDIFKNETASFLALNLLKQPFWTPEKSVIDKNICNLQIPIQKNSILEILNKVEELNQKIDSCCNQVPAPVTPTPAPIEPTPTPTPAATPSPSSAPVPTQTALPCPQRRVPVFVVLHLPVGVGSNTKRYPGERFSMYFFSRKDGVVTSTGKPPSENSTLTIDFSSDGSATGNSGDISRYIIVGSTANLAATDIKLGSNIDSMISVNSNIFSTPANGVLKNEIRKIDTTNITYVDVDNSSNGNGFNLNGQGGIVGSEIPQVAITVQYGVADLDINSGVLSNFCPALFNGTKTFTWNSPYISGLRVTSEPSNIIDGSSTGAEYKFPMYSWYPLSNSNVTAERAAQFFKGSSNNTQDRINLIPYNCCP